MAKCFIVEEVIAHPENDNLGESDLAELEEN